MKLNQLQQELRLYDAHKGFWRKNFGDQKNIKALKLFVTSKVDAPDVEIKFSEFEEFIKVNKLASNFAQSYFDSGSSSSNFFDRWRKEIVVVLSDVILPPIDLSSFVLSGDMFIIPKVTFSQPITESINSYVNSAFIPTPILFANHAVKKIETFKSDKIDSAAWLLTFAYLKPLDIIHALSASHAMQNLGFNSAVQNYINKWSSELSNIKHAAFMDLQMSRLTLNARNNFFAFTPLIMPTPIEQPGAEGFILR